MPLILNGSSLLLGTAGSLATTNECCCVDDPPRCFCPDLCRYVIEITSPTQFSWPPVPCTVNWAFQLLSEESLKCICNPETGAVPNLAFLGVVHPFFGDIRVLPGSKSSDEKTGPNPEGIRDAGWALFFSWELESCPVDLVSTSLFLRFRIRATASGSQEEVVYEIVKTLDYPLFVSCQPISGKLFCSGESRRSVVLPDIAVTASLDQISLGEWVTQSTEGTITEEVQSCLDTCILPISIQFKITKRPSCRIVTCSCAANLDGLLATFDGKEFVLGDDEEFENSEDEYEESWIQTSGGNSYTFRYEKLLPGAILAEFRQVTLYCATDEEEDPPVPRWFAAYETTCYVYEDGTNIAETEDAWIGYLICYESAGCNGRAEGQAIPGGSPLEIERLPDYPIVSLSDEATEEDACTAPTYPTFSLSEICG